MTTTIQVGKHEMHAGLLTRMQVEERLMRCSAGRYDLDGVFAVERHDSGWRWFRLADPACGGEWRITKREAIRDLAAYLNTNGQ